MNTQKPKLVFGLRDFPRPRGEGFLFYKLHPDYKEKTLVCFNLLKTDESGLKDVFSEGLTKMCKVQSLKDTLEDHLEDYGTENMQEWATTILNEVIQNYRHKKTTG